MNSYTRMPALFENQLVFVTDDDLWRTQTGSTEPAQRLTQAKRPVSHPRWSPDGDTVALVAAEEGPQDVYSLPSAGGPLTRLTFSGSVAAVCGFSADGSEIIYSCSAGEPFAKDHRLFAVSVDGGPARALHLGPAIGWDEHRDGRVVLCRHTNDLARWKRYRGGRAGQLWVDDGTGNFSRIPLPAGNVASPVWLGDRIAFLSDHDYDANLYSVLPDGTDLQKHSAHTGFFPRHLTRHQNQLVYSCGGDLYRWSEADEAPTRLAPCTPKNLTRAQRRFVPTGKHIQGISIHPKGHSVALEVRGKGFTMGLWHGAVRQHGPRDGVRTRLIRWLPDGERFVCISDASGEEQLEIHHTVSGVTEVLTDLDIGRVLTIDVSPKEGRIALTNQRQQLLVITLEERTVTPVAHALTGRLGGVDWSPDGRWLAYAYPCAPQTAASQIVLWSVETGVNTPITDGRSMDWSPSFDPDGKYLYFLGKRDLDPVYDGLFFDLNFPKGSRPWAVTLRSDVPVPFAPDNRPADAKISRNKPPKTVRIELEGIEDRMVKMPVHESQYHRIVGLPDGHALLTRRGVKGSLDRKFFNPAPPKADVNLLLWDRERRELVLVDDRITDFGVDLRRKAAWIQSGWAYRVVPAKADKGRREELKRLRSGRPGRTSGLLDLTRVRCEVHPQQEWRQIFHESWRLMRDHFWTEDMSGVDWDAAKAQYGALLDRVSTRAELSDLIWTLQGELGTSHAYEMGGDHQRGAYLNLGVLAADYVWDARGGWRITHICRGDPGQRGRTSPLLEPGVNARVGDRITRIDGIDLTSKLTVSERLVHRAEQDVSFTLVNDQAESRQVTIRPLRDDRNARYRDWVRQNREAVHQATEGRCGYVHVPDMGPTGYAEFHRDFMVEHARESLIVDVRYNRGGHVSQLILEKVARKPIGWSVSRWGSPRPYPGHSIRGPRICLTNEMAGSDGDIFSHNWKQLNLGPLLGQRTWGGVIGIWPRHHLVDKGITTQPEFSNWFADAGWTLENRGTDPTMDVVIKPQDYAQGLDPQLSEGIAWISQALDDKPAPIPDFGPRPYLGRSNG